MEAMDYVEKIELVTYLVDYLLRERNQDNGDVAYCPDLAVAGRAGGGAGEGRAHAGADADADADARAAFANLWSTFRALVNTRVPCAAADKFYALQDKLLRALIAEAGITDAASLPACVRHPRVAHWTGDITTLRVDAIVNAANSQMLGCWVPGHHCIDNAIHTFAGVQLREDCARLMSAQGHDEPTGAAKVTPAFNLPSKYVIHTVGPIANGAPSAAQCAQLASCYTSCIDAAAQRGLNSVAFCCISTGVFGFPQEAAAKIAVEAVEGWLQAHAAARAGEAGGEGPAGEAGGGAGGEGPAGVAGEGGEGPASAAGGDAAAAGSGETGAAFATPMRVIFNTFTPRDQAIYARLLG